MIKAVKEKRKLNNSGSTMVIVLIMTSFILILATVLTTSTALNLKMKMTDKTTTKIFYTSEDAVNEIYVALGQVSIECFNAAYQEEISNVVSKTKASGSYTVDNITCNTRLRQNYVHRMLNKLGVVADANLESIKYTYSDYLSAKEEGTFVRSSGTSEVNGIVAILGTYIENSHKDDSGNPTLLVKSIDSFKVISKKSSAEGIDKYPDDSLFAYVIELDNCVVEYLTEDGFYSYITFDCSVGMPDSLVNITDSESLTLDSFVQYSLIGNKGITVDSSKVLSLNGNAFGGNANGTGIEIKPGATLSVKSGNSLSTSGDIDVKDGTLTTEGDVNIWCYNLKTSNDSGSKGTPTVNISSSTNTYVRDDLEINGDNSNVNVAGNYYGYGYESDNASNIHSYSSSITINSKRSNLNLTNLNRLVVAGKAYVDYASLTSNASPYSTGESVSLIGNQEIYLVPPSLMGGSNPVNTGSGITVNITNENDFFGYDYIDPTTPYVIKTVKGDDGVTRDFYYLKFINDKNAADYVKAILDDSTFNTIIAGKSASIKEKFESQRAYMKKLITFNAESMGSVITAGSGNINTKSTMIAAAPGNGINGLSYVASTSDSYDFYNDFEDLSCRYTVLTKTLYELTTSTHMNNNLVNQMYPKLSSYSTNVYSNIIATNGFTSYTSGNNGPKMDALTGGYKGMVLCAFDNSNTGSAPLIISDDTEVLPQANNATYSFKDYSGGVVVCSGNVVIKKNFNGTIIAGGTITIEDNVTVGGLANITDLVKTNQKFAEIFKVWNPMADSDDSGFLDVQKMTYKDMVMISNWRKYNDASQP